MGGLKDGFGLKKRFKKDAKAKVLERLDDPDTLPNSIKILEELKKNKQIAEFLKKVPSDVIAEEFIKFAKQLVNKIL